VAAAVITNKAAPQPPVFLVKRKTMKIELAAIDTTFELFGHNAQSLVDEGFIVWRDELDAYVLNDESEWEADDVRTLLRAMSDDEGE
jgi:hypothetical protein